MFDVAVIGGGVVGTLVARELAKYELTVVLLERENDVAVGATRANSGIVHAGFDAPNGSLMAAMNVRGAALMPALTRELQVPYRNNGTLVVAFNDEELAVARELLARGERNGVERLEVIDSERLHALEPHITAEAVGALYAPTAGIVCPYGLAIAAMGNAMQNGAELIRNFEVRAIEDAGSHFAVSADGQTVEARYLVNAAGLYSDEVAAMAGDRSFAVHPRRGEYLLLDSEFGAYVGHTVFQMPTKMGKSILVTPTVDGNLLVGPTAVDIEDKEDRRVTTEGLAAVTAKARRVLPDIPLSGVITSFTGLRARGDRHDFIIAPSPVQPRLLHLAGIASPGLASSPAIAERARELLGTMGLTLKPKADFDPHYENIPRLRSMSSEERARLIAQDSRFARIVCRCEEISEGEIVAAIRRQPGALDCDGVKRRVRAGMGRCQGGFCLPTVAEILSRELGIPLTAVTKNGEGSELLTGRTK